MGFARDRSAPVELMTPAGDTGRGVAGWIAAVRRRRARSGGAVDPDLPGRRARHGTSLSGLGARGPLARRRFSLRDPDRQRRRLVPDRPHPGDRHGEPAHPGYDTPVPDRGDHGGPHDVFVVQLRDDSAGADGRVGSGVGQCPGDDSAVPERVLPRHRGRAAGRRSPGVVMRKIDGEQVLMRMFVGESDRAGHRPLHVALLELLRARGLAGATVVKGVAGFGANSVIHTSSILRLSEDLPLVIEVVDTAEHLEALLPEVDRLMKGGLITMEKVRVLRYAPDEKG